MPGAITLQEIVAAHDLVFAIAVPIVDQRIVSGAEVGHPAVFGQHLVIPQHGASLGRGGGGGIVDTDHRPFL